MRDAGVELRVDSSGLGVIGLAEIIRHYGEIRGALSTMRQVLKQETPDLLICVDYKEFNFRLAKTAKSLGIKVLFYVSPQVWAWRQGRVKSYGRVIDHMAVIFPFEVPFYEQHGIPVTFVGHPLAGKVKAEMSSPEAFAHFGLSKLTPVIGLLPGSRTNEIKRLLPIIVRSAELLSRQFEGAQFVLFQAPTVTDDLLQQALKNSTVGIRIVKGQNYEVLQCCDAVMTVSGTATLEVALMGVPMCILYRLSPLSYWLGRMLVKIPWIGLPNILAGRTIVREFIQHDANPDNIVAEIGSILRDTHYADRMRQDLKSVRDMLEAPRAAHTLAALARNLLVDTTPP